MRHTFNDAWATRRNNFDAIRLVLAIVVVFGHSYSLSRGTSVQEPLGILHHHLEFGGISVAGFFAISGLLITNSWLNRPCVSAFFRNRILRIYPGYIACSAVCAYIVVPISGSVAALSVRHIAGWARMTLLLRYFSPASIFPGNPFPGVVNGSLWTIRYEFVCYIAVALAGITRLIRQRWLIAIGFTLWWATLIACHGVMLPLDWGSRLDAFFGAANTWAGIAPYFVVGMMVRLYMDRIPNSPVWAGIAAALIVLSYATDWATVVVLPVAGVYLLCFVALLPVGRLYQFGQFGDFSYGTYLYAYPIQQLVVQHWIGISPLALFFVSTPLAILAGAASWFAVEQHFIRRKHRRNAVATVSAAVSRPTNT